MGSKKSVSLIQWEVKEVTVLFKVKSLFKRMSVTPVL